MHTPTNEQAAIVCAARDTDRNLLVSALAGAAKTTTLELIAQAMPSMEILALAFNKKMAVEMQERMPSNVKAMTLNALGHRTWMDATGRRLKINSSKTYEIVNELVRASPSDDLWELFAELIRIVDFGKSCGYIPTGHFDQAKALMRDDEFFSHLEQKLTDGQIDLIRAATLQSLQLAMKGDCDFNDQILMPTVFHGAFPRYPLILVDEAQDLSALNHATLRKMVGKRRLIAVGDPCQPAGTQVTKVLATGVRGSSTVLAEVPIETLRVGDTLLGYNSQGSFMYNRRVEGVSQNYFEGNLVTVSMAGFTSKYTENHHCYASFEPFRNHFALYLMRQENKFRIGRCRMFYKGEGCSGPTRRAMAECADAYWLLGLYKTEREAAIEEAVAQAQFGIPDITFKCPNTNVGLADQSYLDEAWSYITTSVDLVERAAECLDKYNRVIEYPIWTSGNNAKFSLLRPSIIHACNLVTGCLMLPYRKRSKILAEQWTPVEVQFDWVKDLSVWSLTVSDNQLYVADGIVTHNCQAIYGFRGAHEESMSLLREEFDMQELPLTISFRCPQSVVAHVRWRAPQMRWPEWAITGQVRTLSSWTSDTLPDDAVIICRNNAPLFAVAIKLLKTGRSCELHGKDVVASITKVMRKFGGHDLPQHTVLEKIETWLAVEMEKNKVRAHNRLADRAACMKVFALEGATLGDALAYAQHLSQLRSPLKLMTGHSSKGMEYDHVFFLDQHLIGKEDQEPNLRYVICTRARESLTYIRSEDFLTKEEYDGRMVA